MNYYSATIKRHVAEITVGIFGGSLAKFILSFTAFVIDYLLGGNEKSIAALYVLVTFDFITALMAKFRMGEAITSKRALKTATKVVVYGLFISAATLTERIVPGTTFMDEIAISFLAVTELISIMENIAKLGYAMPQKLLNQLYQLKK